MATEAIFDNPKVRLHLNIHTDILNGSHLSAARLIKLIENNEPESHDALKKLYPHTGHSFIVGITGPPGAGKSTLFDRLIHEFRKESKKVAILGFDPTSPITGGAILGDRIRMNRHSRDSGVFIRSIATRGALGGISRAAKGALIVLDAMKFDVILIETAGIGQIGSDISLLTHMTIVVCIPGMGDGLQIIKAGTLELADLYVVNKADLPGAGEVRNHLESLLKLKDTAETKQQPEIIMASATNNEGIDDIMQAISSFRQRLQDGDGFGARSHDQTARYLEALIKQTAAECFWEHIRDTLEFQEVLAKVENRQIDPYSATKDIMDRLLRRFM